MNGESQPDIETYSAISSALMQAICYANAFINKTKSLQSKSSSEFVQQEQPDEPSTLGILDNKFQKDPNNNISSRILLIQMEKEPII